MLPRNEPAPKAAIRKSYQSGFTCRKSSMKKGRRTTIVIAKKFSSGDRKRM